MPLSDSVLSGRKVFIHNLKSKKSFNLLLPSACTNLSDIIHWNILQVTCIFLVCTLPKLVCEYRDIDSWDVPKRCITSACFTE